VPFRGTGAALPVLLGGQIEMIFGDTAVLAPNVVSKNLIGLAVTSPERSPLASDLPTVAEAGFPSLEGESWYGLLAPAKTPPDVLKKLQDAVLKTLADPAYQEAARKQGSATVDTSADKFARLIAAETAKWGPVVKAAGFDIK
jgi:tripartite-type tricarboxylate transporter receptor subunit TctC